MDQEVRFGPNQIAAVKELLECAEREIFSKATPEERRRMDAAEAKIRQSFACAGLDGRENVY